VTLFYDVKITSKFQAIYVLVFLYKIMFYIKSIVATVKYVGAKVRSIFSHKRFVCRMFYIKIVLT
jgi:hypothetical protein